VRPRSDTGARIASVTGLVAAALYSDWLVLEPVIGRDLSPTRSYVSELAARTQPGHVIANTLDLVCALCLLPCCARLTQALRADRAPAAAVHGTYALIGFAAATALNALVPMSCAPSLQPDCRAGGLALHGPAEDLTATALSVIAVGCSLASMALMGHGLARVPAWRNLARTGRALFIPAAPLALLVGALGALDVAVGLPQRALIVLQAAWMARLAISVNAPPPSPARSRSRRAD
jgi:Protein of unknown function (DUF998)